MILDSIQFVKISSKYIILPSEYTVLFYFICELKTNYAKHNQPYSSTRTLGFKENDGSPYLLPIWAFFLRIKRTFLKLNNNLYRHFIR